MHHDRCVRCEVMIASTASDTDTARSASRTSPSTSWTVLSVEESGCRAFSGVGDDEMTGQTGPEEPSECPPTCVTGPNWARSSSSPDARLICGAHPSDLAAAPETCRERCSITC